MIKHFYFLHVLEPNITVIAPSLQQNLTFKDGELRFSIEFVVST